MRAAAACWGCLEFGRDERIRTSDPHTPSVMRYQAALRPDRRAAFRRMLAKMQGLLDLSGPSTQIVFDPSFCDSLIHLPLTRFSLMLLPHAPDLC